VDALRAGEPEHDQVIVENHSEWDALNVDVEVALKSGEKKHDFRERVRPLVLRDGKPTGDLFVLDLGPAGPAADSGLSGRAAADAKLGDDQRSVTAAVRGTVSRKRP
jgi:hypothetical protein